MSGHGREGSPLMLSVIKVLVDMSNVGAVSGRITECKPNQGKDPYTNMRKPEVHAYGQAVHACELRTLSKRVVDSTRR